ncbi:MAG: hypothetical protein COA79_07705 [Planctomycetota bacterium]|nr:MAG: hypothetical protein COA79_07705 [Planctomycetota bacterium]
MKLALVYFDNITEKIFKLMVTKKISHSLLKAVLIISFIFSLITTGIQLYINYQLEIKFIDKELSNVESGILDPLGLAIWTIDRDQVDTLIKGILNIEDVVRVQVKAKKSKIFIDIQKPGLSPDVVNKNLIRFGDSGVLGELIIYTTHDRLKSKLWNNFLVILFTQLLKTVFVSMLLLLVFHWLVVDPIQKILLDLNAIKGDSIVGSEPHEISSSRKNLPDEFSELISSINSMLKKINDFTLKKKEEDHASQIKYEETLHANRLTTLGGLSAELAHEVNNPNGAILFNANTLKKICSKIGEITKDFQYQTEVDESISEILEASSRINGVIDQLKNYSNKKSIDKKIPMKPISALEAAIKMLRYKFSRKKLLVEYSDNSGGKLILANPLTLEQVFVNILDNAFNAVPEVDGLIEILISKEADLVSISIKDNGSGIDQKISNSVSEAFITTRSTEGGTGLGLYVTSRIIKEHQGSLNISSPNHGGTVVTITFPHFRGKS